MDEEIFDPQLDTEPWDVVPWALLIFVVVVAAYLSF